MPLDRDRPTYTIEERESGQYTAAITGNDGGILPGTTLTTLTLTVYVTGATGVDTILNSRDNQNVLNLNNVQVLDVPVTRADGSQYNLIWTIQPADVAIVNDALRHERHVCLFQWTWPTGNAGKHEFYLSVRNLRRVA